MALRNLQGSAFGPAGLAHEPLGDEGHRGHRVVFVARLCIGAFVWDVQLQMLTIVYYSQPAAWTVPCQV